MFKNETIFYLHFALFDRSISTAIISTILDALIIRLCNSNVCAELSIVSIRSIGNVGEAIISLLLLSNRCETVRTISALGESVSSTP
jgi:hypothetical protein